MSARALQQAPCPAARAEALRMPTQWQSFASLEGAVHAWHGALRALVDVLLKHNYTAVTSLPIAVARDVSTCSRIPEALAGLGRFHLGLPGTPGSVLTPAVPRFDDDSTRPAPYRPRYRRPEASPLPIANTAGAVAPRSCKRSRCSSARGPASGHPATLEQYPHYTTGRRPTGPPYLCHVGGGRSMHPLPRIAFRVATSRRCPLPGSHLGRGR